MSRWIIGLCPWESYRVLRGAPPTLAWLRTLYAYKVEPHFVDVYFAQPVPALGSRFGVSGIFTPAVVLEDAHRDDARRAAQTELDDAWNAALAARDCTDEALFEIQLTDEQAALWDLAQVDMGAGYDAGNVHRLLALACVGS